MLWRTASGEPVSPLQPVLVGTYGNLVNLYLSCEWRALSMEMTRHQPRHLEFAPLPSLKPAGGAAALIGRFSVCLFA